MTVTFAVQKLFSLIQFYLVIFFLVLESCIQKLIAKTNAKIYFPCVFCVCF